MLSHTCLHTCSHTHSQTHTHVCTHAYTQDECCTTSSTLTGVPLKSKWAKVLPVMEKGTLAHKKTVESFLCMCKAKFIGQIMEKAQGTNETEILVCDSGWVTHCSHSVSSRKKKEAVGTPSGKVISKVNWNIYTEIFCKVLYNLLYF